MTARTIAAQRTVDGVYRVTTSTAPPARVAPNSWRNLEQPCRTATRPATVLNLRLRQPQGQAAIPTRWWRTRTGRAIAWAAAVCAVALGGLVAYLAVLVARWITEHLAQIGAVLAVAAVVWLLINRARHSGACPGLHCKGCKK